MRWPTALLVGLLCLLYLRSPIDLLPDRIGAVGLLDDLVVLLLSGLWLWRRLAGGPRPKQSHGAARQGESAAWDPYKVLGVDREATTEDIAHAYREQMKRYHPDRVAGLGDELQELAHRRTVEIQRAYSEITQR